MDIQKRRTFIISFYLLWNHRCALLYRVKETPAHTDSLHGRHGYCSRAGTGSVSTGQTHEGRKGRGRRGCAAGLLWFHSDNHVRVWQPNPVIHPGTGKKLPGIYSQTIEPGLSHFFSLLENSFPGHSIHISALGQSLERFMENASVGISSGLLGGAPLP